MKIKRFDKYFIVTRNGEALELCLSADVDQKKILWSGLDVTLFKTEREARNALARTVRYAQKHAYFWGDRSLYRVVTARTVAE